METGIVDFGLKSKRENISVIVFAAEPRAYRCCLALVLLPLEPGINDRVTVTVCVTGRGVTLWAVQWRRFYGVLAPSFSGSGVPMFTGLHFLLPCCCTWSVIHSISSADSG